jgi:hypothetical protein
MQEWEFLIQQEGERTWQSSKESQLEITPGNYRIMAHTPYPNQEIEIRLTQEEIIEQTHTTTKNTQTRRTNAQGLLMVIPYTAFNPGTWEIRCSGDIMTELLGNPWQEVLQITIKAETTAAVLDLPLPPTPSVEDYIQELEAILEQKIAPFLESQAEPQPSLEIVLVEDTFIRNRGENITITGKITGELGEGTNLPNQSKIIYQLRRTQTGERILHQEYSLTQQECLESFSHTLELLDNPVITFLLGEVFWETATGVILAKQTFTISTDITSPEISAVESTPLPQALPTTTISINHSILPPKISKNYSPRKTVELPPIRPRN